MEQTFPTIQRVLILGVALILALLAILATWETLVSVWRLMRAGHLTTAVAAGTDSIFLTVILLELLHTVISRGPLLEQTQEFIVIGITSVIRHGLSLVATAGIATAAVSGAHGGAPPNARDIVIDLAINSASVLLLVVALWLIRRHASSGSIQSDTQTSGLVSN